MKLRDWLAREGMTQSAFAKALDTSQGYVADLCAGTRWPGREIARNIVVATKGQVTPNDFLMNGNTSLDGKTL